MSSAYGHRIRQLTQEELAADSQRQAEAVERWGDEAKHWYSCRHPKCTEMPTHMTRYSYVTGRGGRVSWQERPMCERHANAFLAKHTNAAAIRDATYRPAQIGEEPRAIL